MVRPSMRGGVPVLSRPVRGISSRSRAGKAQRWWIARAAAREILEADMDAAAEKCAGGEHHGARGKRNAGGSEHSTHATAAQLQIRNFLLEHIEPWL